jgi:hypothetical protein
MSLQTLKFAIKSTFLPLLGEEEIDLPALPFTLKHIFSCCQSIKMDQNIKAIDEIQ